MSQQLARFLTAKQAATYLQISLSSLHKMTMNDKIPRRYLRGGAMRFDVRELERWFKKQPPRRRKRDGDGR